MNTRDPRNPDGRSDVAPELIQAEGAEPKKVAAEQFVHGLLESMHRDGDAARERRIRAMLDSLGGEPVVITRRLRLVPWRLASGLAAAIVLMGVILLSIPTQTSAEAVVQATIAASKTAGDRRYQVRAKLPEESEVESRPIATLDVRDADHVLIKAVTPEGDQVVVGRDSEGAWAIRPDGTTDRYPPKHAWPRWVNTGKSTLMLASVDEMLASLADSYTLKKQTAAPLPSGGALCDRLTAVRKPDAAPQPQRLEFWIDPQSHIVRRMELHWDPPRPMGGEAGRVAPGESDEAAAGQDATPNGPRGDGQIGGEGPRPDGPGADQPERDGRGPGPGGEFDPEMGPEDGRGGPPPDLGPGPEGRRDGPPPHRRRPPRHGPGPDGPRPHLDGPDGRPFPPGPEGGPDHRPGRRGPRPEFLGGTPDFAHHPPPPRELVFELVETQPFADTWFSPAAHAGQ